MKKIIIIGAGFSGLSALNRLSKSKLDFQLMLIDKKNKFNFLPLMPDCIGRNIPAEYLSYRIEGLRYKFEFINQEVVSLDLKANKVITAQRTLDYDYLIIASGSETNFYGNQQLEKNAFKLDTLGDVDNIHQRLENDNFDTYIICGGGYTGVEIATNLKRFLDKKSKPGRVIIVERAASLLGPLPQWMKDYVNVNLNRMGIKYLTNTVIEDKQGKKIVLSGRQIFDNAMLIWSAGVKTADFVQKLEIDKSNQGRLKVNQFLQLTDNSFVAGDVANFTYQEKTLRMAVQFSIMEGSIAAENIINKIKGKKLKQYKPVDLGYIIPLANDYSCGRVMGLNVKGRIATLFHFLMCVYRTPSLKNKFGILTSLMKGGKR